jgi:hypothetical protein
MMKTRITSRTRGRLLSLFGYAILSVGALSPAHATEVQLPGRVYIEAKDLSPADMVQVRGFTRPTGKKPWWIYGFRYEPRGSTYARTQLWIYLQPDEENGRVRRGRAMRVEIAASSSARARMPSRVESTWKYAQVAEIGRRPDELKGRSDLQRPFLLDGEFNDQTLVNVVTFIRSSPESEPRRNGAWPARVNGSLPITYVRRSGERIEVTLNVDDFHGESVTLEERNGRLVIVKHGMFIV